MSIVKQLHNSVKFPTSIIVKGANLLGVEIARSLLEQGGYVIIIDSESNASRKLLEPLTKYKNLTVLDFTVISNLADDLRRLDYVFYFEHKSTELVDRISTQKFLQNSNYLDAMLDLTAKFDAKFLLTTSVRAHQLNISNAHQDYNYGLKTQAKNTEYMELELQRYAESLVKEYQEKVGINARVIRLGEIIGRGIEFDESSELVKLIKDGLQGKDLKVPGDGLEATYYIHYLDAAYGILKAQFSASSKGRIFTLANAEEVTILSVSYKLLELLPDANEIKFSSNDDKYPPLVLYKPAENLSVVGWAPRISFERALVQTIEYIQELLIIEEELNRTNALKINDGKNTSEKIRDFFFVAENELDDSDAINNLIDERKKLEMVRTGDMVRANTEMSGKKKKDEKLNIFQKVDLFLHDMIFGLSKRVSFLKNVTIWDLLVTLLLITGFAVIFFILISPLFSLSRDIFMTRNNFEKVTQDVEQFDFKQARQDNIALTNNLSSAQERVEDLQYLFSLTKQQQQYADVQRFLESAIEYSQAYNDLLYAYEPVQEYIETSNLEVIYRFGEDNLMSASTSGTNSDELDQMTSNRGIVADSVSRAIKSGQEVDFYSTKLPERFQNILKNDRSELDQNMADYAYIAEYYPFWPTLLGSEEPINYLILVQDNSRFSPGGGNTVGYITFTMEDGAVNGMKTSVIKKQEIDNRAPTDRAIQEMNLVSTKEITRDNVAFSDIELLTDQQLFLQTIERNYELLNNTEIDLVISTNLSTLGNALQLTGDVEYQQINFSDENLLNGIDLISDTNAQERNVAVMNIYAKTIADRFSSLSANLDDISLIMGNAHDSQEMNYYSNNIELENFIRKANGVKVTPTEEIGFGMNSDFGIEDKIDTYPINSISGVININKDYTTNKSMRLTLNSADNLASSYLCISSGAKAVENIDIADNLTSSAFSDDKLCKIYLKDEDNKYGVKYETGSFAKADASRAVYVLRLKKTPGIESNYDLEFNFGGLSVVPEDDKFIVQDGAYIYSGVLTKDKIFKFELSK